jgi:hypothetical protein
MRAGRGWIRYPTAEEKRDIHTRSAGGKLAQVRTVHRAINLVPARLRESRDQLTLGQREKSALEARLHFSYSCL